MPKTDDTKAKMKRKDYEKELRKLADRTLPVAGLGG